MNYALLLLAGKSTRFNQATPKQFYIVNKKLVYAYSLETLNNAKEIDGIIILTLKEKVLEVFSYAKDHHYQKVQAVIAGGESRNESVKLGILKAKEYLKDDDILLIHDAARPLLTNDKITLAINETKKLGATTFALHSFDTLVKANHYKVTQYLPREEIFRIQTPQTFIFKLIYNAYQHYYPTHDDTELVYNNKHTIHLLKGDERLFKITNFFDIKKLESYLK